MRRGTALLLAAPLALLLSAAPAGAADYVGLGDSYSSGTGTAGEYADNCQRTTTAYPSLIGVPAAPAAPGVPKLPGVATGVNLSCSGARTQHITTQAQAPGNPSPQLQLQGAGPDTDWLTVQIGGNDVGFSDVLTACGVPFQDCNGAIDEAEQKVQTELPAKLAVSYDAARAAAPNAVIAAVGYPRIFRPNQSCNTFFSASEVNRLNAAADKLDAAIRTAAHAKGLAYVSAIGQFIGHGACDSDEWINGLSFGTTSNSYHPKSTGHSLGYAPIVRSGLVNVPDTTIAGAPSNPSGSTAPSFQFTGSATATGFQCKLDGGAFGACASPRQYSGVGEGSHTFHVRAVNAAGNVDQTPASHTWTVDTTAPAVTLAPGVGPAPGSTTTTATASFEFSSDDPAAALACRLDSGEFEPCSSPKQYAALSDGAHTVTIRASDSAGNAATASRSWTVDTLPPQATVNSGPGNPTPATEAEIHFSVDEPGATIHCRLDGVEIEPCASPQHLDGLGEGEHSFEVWAVDGAGNEGPVATYSWTVDLTAPAVTIDSGPAALSNEDEAEFSFSADEPGTSFACRVDDGEFEPCSSPRAYGGLGEGEHTFTVRATDPADQVATASYTWTVDLTVPEVTIAPGSGPIGAVSSTSAEFEFGADDPGASLACRLDDGEFEPCVSPASYAGLAEGPHTFTVRAADAAGNAGSGSRGWTVDTTPPTAAIGSKPPAASNQRSASFGFSSPDGGGAFECRLDSAEDTDFEPCASPKAYDGLGDGAHSFSVRAIDAAGNVGPPTAYGWSIDATGPTVAFSQNPPDVSGSSSASFGFGASEPGSSFDCRLDGAIWQIGCSSPRQLTGLADGPHLFEVRARDPLGNLGPEAGYQWVVDTVDPTVAIGSAPPPFSASSSAEFGFAVSADTALVECRLDAGAFVACEQQAGEQGTGGHSYSGLADGAHTFTVRATDGAGRTGSDSRSWTVDKVAPQVAIGTGPSGPVNSSTASFQFSAVGGSTQCSLDGSPFGGCSSSSSQTYSGLNEGPHTFVVRSVDQAGNVGSDSRAWTVDLTPPETTISSAPPAVTGSTAASFSFTASEAEAGFQCSADGAAFAACSSPASYSGLGAGEHGFRVRAIDPAGNVDPTPAGHSWRVELAASGTAGEATPEPATPRKRCKKGSRLVKRKGKRRCVKKKGRTRR